MEIVTLDGYKPMHSGEEYLGVIRAAKASNPTPFQSGYRVKTGAMTASGKIVSGGNYEYGLTRANHGEQSVLVGAQNQYPGDLVTIMGFSADEFSGRVPRHCGNCRDNIIAAAHPDMETIAGTLEKVLVLPFKQTYTREDEDFERTYALNADELEMTSKLSDYVNLTSNPYSTQEDAGERVYAAGIAFGGSEWIHGLFLPDVAYWAANPIQAATIKWQGAVRDKRDQNIETLVVVLGPKASVPYVDRQHFMEFLDLYAKTNNVPVLLARQKPVGEPGWDYFKTTSQEWLPYPFTPSVLMNDQELAAEREIRQKQLGIFYTPDPDPNLQEQ
ncbi:hypothetical protein JW711_06375 [Candidatus Woesearchaeota archaeon]|nr:hypothetical protein [Candidatus Woesearchaeota archaeon]